MSELRDDIEAAMAGTLGEGGEAPAPEAPAATEGAGGGEAPAALAEAPGVDAPGEDGVAPAGETPAQAAARARDEKGRFAPGSKEARAAEVKAAKPTSAVAKASTALAANAKPVASAVPPAGPAEALKPPESWRPAAREEWAKLPPAVQAEAVRVDREVRRVFHESTGARRFADSFSQVVAPHMAAIQAEGGDPLQTVQGLLQTAQALRGPQRAHVVANIMRQFGVSEEALVGALQGQPAQGNPQEAGGQGGYRDPRLEQVIAQHGQLMSRLEAAHQQRQEAVTARANRDVQVFSEKAEFLEDLRPHMALLLKEAADRGQGMTLDDAYDAACWANREVRAILQQREAAKAANASTASTQRARQASSSIRSQPATAGTAAPDGSIRGDIMDAWSKLSSR